MLGCKIMYILLIIGNTTGMSHLKLCILYINHRLLNSHHLRHERVIWRYIYEGASFVPAAAAAVCRVLIDAFLPARSSILLLKRNEGDQ